ncbi:MAG: 50S ribosomal protein P1 [Nitrosopumilaceae archaeon]|nr:50S ribosomal protein P1 [Nitrosopumilaceae archaeon]
MEYVYAALILHKLKKEINESNVTSIIKAAGSDVDTAKVKTLIASLSDVDIEKIISSSNSVPVQSTQKTPEDTNKKKESSPKEEKSGKSEEQAMEGLASLFG